MNRRGWVFTLVYIVTAVSLLLTGASAIAAEPTEQKEPPKQTKPFEQLTDANKNKIFDNLEKRMVPAGTEQPFGIIIQFTQPLSEIDFPFLKHDIGPFSTRYEYPSINAISTTLTKGQIIAASKHGLVKQIEFNGEVHAFLDTSTDWFGVKKARGDFGVDGNADGLATYSKDDIVIAIIDTGIDPNHMDLAGKVIGWADFVSAKPTTAFDDHGHGTHVASIAAGTGQASSETYTGVAPGAALVGVKVLDKNGSGTFDDVDAGIQWVISNKTTYGIEVMSLSLGASGSSDGTSTTEELVNAAVAAGIVAVVAAGNDGPWSYTIGVPAAAAKAITVGAMADVGELGFFQAYWSSRGPTADERIKPDISSPGWYITAAKYNSSNGYTTMSGTSMATPFVAGVAALMLDANPNLLPDVVKTTMMGTAVAVDWGPSGKDIDYGAGRLDAYQAIQTAKGSAGTGPIVPSHDYKADSLGGQNSSDWWDISVASTAYPIAITMIMPQWSSYTNPDFDMRLYAPNGTQVGSSFGMLRQETISYQPTVTGVYRLMVFVYNGNGPYFFDVSAGTTLPSISNPLPTTTSILPTSKTVGDAAFTLTVNGTNFIASSVVRFNGADRTTSYVSATQLTASIPASDLLTAGIYNITVFNPTPGGGTSNAQTFTVNNPVPTTTGISPTSKTVGDGVFTLTVNGTNFIASSVVRFAGSDRTTTYVSATQLTAAIPASDLTTAGAYNITVFNPAPGGGTSNAQSLAVNPVVGNPVPTTTGISPTSKTVGDTGFTLTVNGTNFIASSVVRFAGSDRTTTYVSVTQLTASIPASDLLTAGTYNITVFNPTPGGGTSNAQTFTVNPGGVTTWSSSDLETGVWSGSGNTRGRTAGKDYSYTPPSGITNMKEVRVTINVSNYSNRGSSSTDPYLEVYVKGSGGTLTRINGRLVTTGAGLYTFKSITVLDKILPGVTNTIRVVIGNLYKSAGVSDLVAVDSVKVQIDYQP